MIRFLLAWLYHTKVLHFCHFALSLATSWHVGHFAYKQTCRQCQFDISLFTPAKDPLWTTSAAQMRPSYADIRRYGVSVATAAILDAILPHLEPRRHPRGNHRGIVHPGGPLRAQYRVERLLAGSNKEFFKLFRVTIAKFRALV